jgi:hypothetical protein
MLTLAELLPIEFGPRTLFQAAKFGGVVIGK